MSEDERIAIAVLQREFIDEARGHLATIREALDWLGRDAGDGAALARLVGAVHAIADRAPVAGYHALGVAAAQLETRLLDRAGMPGPTGAM